MSQILCDMHSTLLIFLLAMHFHLQLLLYAIHLHIVLLISIYKLLQILSSFYIVIVMFIVILIHCDCDCDCYCYFKININHFYCTVLYSLKGLKKFYVSLPIQYVTLIY